MRVEKRHSFSAGPSPAGLSPAGLLPAILLLGIILTSVNDFPLFAESPFAESRFPRSSHIHPTPDPFTLNGRDAIQALWLIRRAGLLLHHTPGGTSETIVVRRASDVRAVHAGHDPNAPGRQHAERYDIEIDGEPLDWRNTFIRYGGYMTNLQLLFTYRNQTPPEGLRYRLDQ